MKHSVRTSRLILVALLTVTPAAAQDNPVPLNYPHLTVTVMGTYGNNQNRPLNGSTVLLTPRDPANDPQFADRYPMRQTVNGGVARFRIAPSSLVGPYTITVESNTCGTEEIANRILNGAGPTQLTFNLDCNANRRSSRTGRSTASQRHALTVNVDADEAYGPLKVVLKNSEGREIGRSHVNRSQALLRNVPSGENYNVEIQVFGRNLRQNYPPLMTLSYTMPDENAELEARLDRCM